MTAKILVLGATGAVGRSVVEALVARGADVRAASRRPAAAQSNGRVEVVPFDLEQPSTFAPALAGVERVFLISRPGDEHPEVPALPFLSAMRAARVQRVVNLSAIGVEHRPDFGLRKVEVALEGSGMAWTHLRPNFFFQVFSSGSLLRGIVARGEIRLPAADARLSFLDARDVGAVGAAALVDPGHEGRAYTLTGSEALDHAEVAAILSRAAARSITYVPIDEDEARIALAAAGFPPAWVERLIGFYRVVRSGAGAVISSAVSDVLGRPPNRLAAFAEEHVSLWSIAPEGDADRAI